MIAIATQHPGLLLLAHARCKLSADRSVLQRGGAMRRRGRLSWLYSGGILLLTGTVGRHVDAFLAIPLTNGQHWNRKHYQPAVSSESDQQQLASISAPTLSDNAPSWETLRQLSLETPTGSRLDKERSARELGLGPPHTDALLRLFQSEETSSSSSSTTTTTTATSACNDVRVTLYRDHAGWCPYCQKVWLLLELKAIPYRVKKVPMNAYGDKPAWYTRKVNGGKLPAVGIDGELHVESLDIMHLLDETFENHAPKMVPPPTERKRFDALLLLEKELQSAWFSLVFYPIDGEALQKANRTFLDTLARVDQELSVTDGPWFLGGEAPSLVDLQYVTHIERILPSVLYWKGLSIRRTGTFPHLDQWLSAMEELPAYLASRSDYYTHIMVMPSQNGPGFMIPQAKSIAAQICGLTGGSWRRPLDLNESLEHFPRPACSTDSNHPAEEAAFQVIINHGKVVHFACRGAGDPGRPAFHAELADPYAEPNKDYAQPVDVCLRHVVHALLTGTTDSVMEAAKKDLCRRQGNDELRENWEAYPDEENGSLTYYWNYETGEVTWTAPTQQLDTCLTYLRDRIGVPRDMSSAAGMQLRAILNWAIDVMRDVKT